MPANFARHYLTHMKLLAIASLLLLSISAVRAQTATGASSTAVNPLAAAGPLGGYLVVFPQVPVTTVRFDGNSEDIAKVPASHVSTAFNHDGTAFNNFVRSTSSESYNANVVEHDHHEKNVAEYQKNVKSHKWSRFVNGE
jgi:hypothetical protein